MEEKKLESFSKAEIIQAIRNMARTYNYGRGFEKAVIESIEVVKRDKAFAEAQMARQTAIDRMNEFFNWKKEMVKKYGNVKQVKLSDLPRIELERGAKLQKAWNDSENERKRAEKQEDKYFGRKETE